MSNDILLKVQDLRIEFGQGDAVSRAVDGISFEIRRGETFALLGESGCGKSMTAMTVMRLLPGAARITSGQIFLDGVDLLSLPESDMRQVRGGKVAMIFQEPMTSLNPVMTIGDQIGESLQIHKGLKGVEAEAKALELLEAVGIPEPQRRIKEYPHQLSGGQKQRVMIAIALAGDPELLIADEPTTALDVTIQAQVLELLKDLQKRFNMAILFITHDLAVVSEMADQVAVMYAGKVVETGEARPFFRAPQHEYSQRLFSLLPDISKRGQRLDIDAEAGEESQGDKAVDTETAEPLLKVSDLKLHYPIRKGLFRRVVDHVRAVDGVSLEIPKGRTLALVGESGCGKTTLGKGILQLLQPTSGGVQFDDTDLLSLKGEALRSRRRDFQVVFQDPFSSMNPRMLVGDIVEEGMRAQGIGSNRAQRMQRVCELLQQVGLPENAINRYPHEFSGGQRQRICIARALAVEPRLIVCDEPTSALDVSVQAQILNLLGDLQKNLDLTYLFITHNLSVVSYFAHEVAVMYFGKIVEQGPVEQVLNDPQHEYTKRLLAAVPKLRRD